MALKLDKTKMVKNLVQNTRFVHHLDRAIGKGDFVWNFDYERKVGDTGWHPSGDCTPSLAELYHKALDPTEEEISASLYKIFMVGHFWHQYLQWVTVNILDFAKPDAIERRGLKGWGDSVLSGDKRHYRDWHYATGSADIAPCYVPAHGEFLIDFKTMGSHMFRPNVPPGDTIVKWECQLNIYMDFFDIERALIVGINKDSPHDFKEFSFTRNQPLVDAIYHKWELVSACLDEEVEPPIDEEVHLPLKGPDEY